jgi:hypothetical protein
MLHVTLPPPLSRASIAQNCGLPSGRVTDIGTLLPMLRTVRMSETNCAWLALSLSVAADDEQRVDGGTWKV